MDNYEQKYREALKKAEAFYYSATTEPITEREVLAKIFPELKESEDERAKKEITELVMQPTWKTEKEFHRRKELCAWLEKQGEQKPAWSEEDEEMLDSIIEEVRYIGDFPDYPTKEENELYDECLAKVDWLKSIKDRCTWRPSYEQMDNLSRAFNGATYRTSLLRDLYLDLKKLKRD